LSAELAAAVVDGDRTALARAITLVESARDDHRVAARELLAALRPRIGGAYRIGLTGVPGVGKSTFVDAFGRLLLEWGHRVAVLAVDPSSQRGGGAILGDKTRMEGLARDGRAFIRPSPSAGTLGGVAAKTREALACCEAAGFDVAIVETVGVGQSETVVADLVDAFVALMLPGAGDELQGIKRGVLEVVDVCAVNKADGDGVVRAERAAAELAAALHLVGARHEGWEVPVRTCSALEETGLAAIHDDLLALRRHLEETGAWYAQRRRQAVRWMWELVDEGLRRRSRAGDVAALEAAVAGGELDPAEAADRLLGG